MTLLFKLLAVHFLADFPLQGDFLARAKNHQAPIPGVPWQTCLLAHAVIHGAGVWLVTRSLYLALLETLLHAGIDYQKNEGTYGFNADQAMHVACKIVWAAVVWFS